MTNKDSMKLNSNLQIFKIFFLFQIKKNNYSDVICHALNIQNHSHLKLERAGGDQKIIYRVQQNFLHSKLQKKFFENK